MEEPGGSFAPVFVASFQSNVVRRKDGGRRAPDGYD
jgi:hypothetical protein